MFSSIWAPQPRAYDIETAMNSSRPGAQQNTAISEGEEADDEFLVGPKALTLIKIRE
jgi:hypothetical protein